MPPKIVRRPNRFFGISMTTALVFFCHVRVCTAQLLKALYNIVKVGYKYSCLNLTSILVIENVMG